MTRAFFVTSSGTEIGKTYVTALLCRAMVKREMVPGALKPIMSGFDADDLPASDAGQLLSALGVPVTPETIASISPWRFTPSISPDMAAKRAGSEIDTDDLVQFCRLGLEAPSDALFIEAAGGIMAPINDRDLMIDWAQRLQFPLILVVGSYLGTISHTLTAIDAAQSRGLTIASLVMSESTVSPVPMEETAETISRYADGISISILGRGADISEVDGFLDTLLKL